MELTVDTKQIHKQYLIQCQVKGQRRKLNRRGGKRVMGG